MNSKLCKNCRQRLVKDGVDDSVWYYHFTTQNYFCDYDFLTHAEVRDGSTD